MVGHGECVGLSQLWKEGLKVLGMNLATAVAKAVQERNSQVFMTFLTEIPLYFWSKMTARTGRFQAARLGGLSGSITSQSGRGRMKLQGYQVC